MKDMEKLVKGDTVVFSLDACIQSCVSYCGTDYIVGTYQGMQDKIVQVESPIDGIIEMDYEDIKKYDKIESFTESRVDKLDDLSPLDMVCIEYSGEKTIGFVNYVTDVVSIASCRKGAYLASMHTDIPKKDVTNCTLLDKYTMDENDDLDSFLISIDVLESI